MQTKSAAQIQAELEFLRRCRERRRESLNRYLAEADPMARAVPYIISCALVISGLCWLASRFI